MVVAAKPLAMPLLDDVFRPLAVNQVFARRGAPLEVISGDWKANCLRILSGCGIGGRRTDELPFVYFESIDQRKKTLWLIRRVCCSLAGHNTGVFSGYGI